MKASRIVREEIFRANYQFSGHLDDEQYDIGSQSLLTLVQMILVGTNIKSQTENYDNMSTATHSLTYLLVFNTVKRERKDRK